MSTIVRTVIQEFVNSQKAASEPAYKVELAEERKRREQLERRMNELVEENKRSRMAAEEAERSSAIRAELHRHGVAKIDLAYRAIKDDIERSMDGSLRGRLGKETLPINDYVARFVNENPELLPARIPGGSGANPVHRGGSEGGSIDIEAIRPGMSAEEREKVRQEIARLAQQGLRSA